MGFNINIGPHIFISVSIISASLLLCGKHWSNYQCKNWLILIYNYLLLCGLTIWFLLIQIGTLFTTSYIQNNKIEALLGTIEKVAETFENSYKCPRDENEHDIPRYCMLFAITYRAYIKDIHRHVWILLVKNIFILEVILLNVILKIVIRQNRRGKSMIHTFTTQMSLKKGLQGKVCISYPIFDLVRLKGFKANQPCNRVSFFS